MPKTKLTLEVEYDANLTDGEGLAVAFDRLLETALSTPGIMDDHGSVKLDPNGFQSVNEPRPDDRIEEWLDEGGFEAFGEALPVTVRELIEDAGRMLDKNGANEILRSPYFKINGKWHTINVEAYVLEADEDIVQERREDLGK